MTSRAMKRIHDNGVAQLSAERQKPVGYGKEGVFHDLGLCSVVWRKEGREIGQLFHGRKDNSQMAKIKPKTKEIKASSGRAEKMIAVAV